MTSCIPFPFPTALGSHSSLGPFIPSFPHSADVPGFRRGLAHCLRPLASNLGARIITDVLGPRQWERRYSRPVVPTHCTPCKPFSIVCGLRLWPLSCAISCNPFSCFVERLENKNPKKGNAAAHLADYTFPDQAEFSTPLYGGIFNMLECLASTGSPANEARVALGMHKATKFHIVECVKGLFVPALSLHHVLATAYPENRRTNAVVLVCYSTCYYGWVVLAMTAAYSSLESNQ